VSWPATEQRKNNLSGLRRRCAKVYTDIICDYEQQRN
jgi:hypothetical protein